MMKNVSTGGNTVARYMIDQQSKYLQLNIFTSDSLNT